MDDAIIVMRIGLGRPLGVKYSRCSRTREDIEQLVLITDFGRQLEVANPSYRARDHNRLDSAIKSDIIIPTFSTQAN